MLNKSIFIFIFLNQIFLINNQNLIKFIIVFNLRI